MSGRSSIVSLEALPADAGWALYLRPVGLIRESAAGALLDQGGAMLLADGPMAFTALSVIVRQGAETRSALGSLTQVRNWANHTGRGEDVKLALDRLSAPRPDFCGLTLDRPRLMGVLNVTPDSFSDGGDHHSPERAIDHGLAMWGAGADIVDVGGESTRPGAEDVSVSEEMDRVVPVIGGLAKAGVRVSVDTRHSAVMDAAAEAGAALINDVSALSGDPRSLATAAGTKLPVVLMHMQGKPRTMQADPVYDDVATDVYRYLENRVAACEAADLPKGSLAVDPGIGFGKTVAHNLQLLDSLTLLHGLGCPVVLGVSRKSFIGRLSRGEAPKDRLPGSLAAALAGVARGVQILRVHDVAETRQAIEIWSAIAEAAAPDQIGSAGG